MSGVYIKDMEMPQSCDDCRLNNGITCYAMPDYMEDGVVGRVDDRPDWCPLVPVPSHGRLIDADEIRADIDEKRPGRSYEDAWALTIIDAAPTVIEAEKGET